jgi:hypothetical protein
MQARTRDNINTEWLIAIIASVQGALDTYKINHRSILSLFKTQNPLTIPLQDLVMRLKVIQAAKNDTADSNQYAHFKKFVCMMQMLRTFVSEYEESFSQDITHIRIKKQMIVALSSLEEVKKFIFGHLAHNEIDLMVHDIAIDTPFLDNPMNKLSAEATEKHLQLVAEHAEHYLHLSHDIERVLGLVLEHLELLASQPTTADALYTEKWSVNNGVAAYPLWNKFCKETHAIFAGENTQEYLLGILATLDISAGLHMRGVYNLHSSSSQKMEDIRQVVAKFKKEIEIFTEANFIKLLTDCVRQNHKKMTAFEIETAWLIEHIIKPFLDKLDMIKQCYRADDPVTALNNLNEQFKITNSDNTEDDLYVGTFRNNLVNITHYTDKDLSDTYDTTGAVRIKANPDPKNPATQLVRSASVSIAYPQSIHGQFTRCTKMPVY